MGRLIKLLLILILLAVAGIAGYAVLGDMSAPTRDSSTPVVINVD